ncbi:MAG: FAD-binding oxidoreductase [Desulfofustis sp.]|nr:FAD-binding oxidoreductase [Desulfofustis sp.]
MTVRDDPEYEAIRSTLTFNARKPPHHPLAIIHVDHVQDIVETVTFARSQNLKISVRGGGHHWSGVAIQDDSLLIDLSRLNQISIDPDKRIAWVQPLVTNRELARHLASHHLAFPTGHCPDVTLSGYLLGGGFGWNGGSWGVACWNVMAVEVVTPDGDLITASENENREWFWAARGGGPSFFGVVTKYLLKLYPLPSHIFTSTLVYPLESLPSLVNWLNTTTQNLPRNVETTLLLTTIPDSSTGATTKRCILSATVFADSKSEVEHALKPFARCDVDHQVMQDLLAPTPFETLFATIDRAFPAGKRYAVDTIWSAASPTEVFSLTAEHFRQAPSEHSLILALLLPPRPRDAPPMIDAAFSLVAPLFVAHYAIWDNEEDDRTNLDWSRALAQDLEHYCVGHYVGESDIVDSPTRLERSFSTNAWKRLQELRRKYDPRGIFDC